MSTNVPANGLTRNRTDSSLIRHTPLSRSRYSVTSPNTTSSYAVGNGTGNGNLSSLKKYKLKRKEKRNAIIIKKSRLWPLYLRLNKSVAIGVLTPMNKVQLSILNTGLIKIDDEGERASGIIPTRPFDLNKTKLTLHIDLLLKYQVLPKIEFHVSCWLRVIIENCLAKVVRYWSGPTWVVLPCWNSERLGLGSASN